MKFLFLFVIIPLTILALWFFTRLGVFHQIDLHETQEGPFLVIYKDHFGAYYKIVPVIEEVEKWARSHGEPCRLSFGEFLDNPNRVAEDRLRSHGGCIVNREWAAKDLPQGFQFREIPARKYVATDFDGAPSLGPFKVYPHAFDYMKEHDLVVRGPNIEIYEVLSEQSVKTHYLFPVDFLQAK